MKQYLVLACFVFMFYAIGFLFVRNYYTNGLPYYDSVGSYWNMFHIMNVTRVQGLIEGLNLAKAYPLSWLQSIFSVVFARFLPTRPEAVLILNFLCLYIAQVSIFSTLMSFKWEKTRALLASLVPVVPQSLMSWTGGFVDMRRDVSMVCLLTASYFLIQKLLYRPKLSSAFIAGIVLGLTQLSRGNVLPYIMIVIFATVTTWIYVTRSRISWKQRVKILTLPIMILTLVSTIYYQATIALVLEKYIGTWSMGGGRIASLRAFFDVPLILFIGNVYDSIIRYLTILILLSVVFLALYRLKMYEWNMPVRKNLGFILSGSLVVLLVIFFNVFIINVNYLGGEIPFFPLLVGEFGIMVWVLSGLRITFQFNTIKRYTLIVTIFILLLIFNAVRIYSARPPFRRESVSAARSAASVLGEVLGGKFVAYAWIDHINVHDLNFYITAQGGLPINAHSKLADDADTEGASDPAKTIEDQRTAFAKGLRTRPYLVVTDDLESYADDSSIIFLFRYGKPVIETILSDKSFERVYTFNDGFRNYYVLKNQI